MRKANEILNTVKSKPYFKDIHKYSCFNKLKSLLPPRFQDAIAFFYIKNNTLFGGLSHPGYKMELNYNKDLVKALLNQLISVKIECKEVFKDVVKIEFFVSKFHTPPPMITEDTDPKYRELASGEFELKVKDRELIEIFNKIKEDIKLNNE
jgi:hypothetical protein